MKTEQNLRKYIRQVLAESVNNFLKKQPETATKQLKDESSSQVIGDPIKDIEMNQLANDLGSDGRNAPTVAVHATTAKSGNSSTTGQHQAKFSDKTELGK